MKSKVVQYYVEGEDEARLIQVLKNDLCVIRPGKVQKLNVMQDPLSDARLMTLKTRTMVVLICDTDIGYTTILGENLEKLRKCPAVAEIVTIPQVPNLEGELVRSCDIKQITDLLGSKSKAEFKTDWLRTKNLAAKLIEHRFNIKQFWCQQSPYRDIKNESQKIWCPASSRQFRQSSLKDK